MIKFIKRGKDYILTIIDKKDNILNAKLTWSETAILFCLVSGLICKQINKRK